MARRLQDLGYQVVASARNEKSVNQLRSEGLTAIQLDLDDSESIQSAVQQTLEICNGKLYALFNNGAYGQPGAVEDLDRNTLRQQLETNVLGWQELTRAVIPVMRAQGEGRIIQNSSVLGLVVFPYRGAYNCSKFALEGLTDTMRVELRGSGIHVCLIEPGPISSNFRANALEKFRQNIDSESSVHHVQYQAMIQRLEKEGDAAPFTLPPEAVLKKVLHALESRNPKPRYYVTFPTHLFGFLRRILSTRMLDRILGRASGGGSR